MVNALAFGVVVCVVSWLGLAGGAGNVGLQQSLRLDPVTFATAYPLAMGLSIGAALLAAYLFARAKGTPPAFAIVGALAVLLGDAAGSLLAAPLLIGELELQHGAAVLLVTSLFGAQVIAAWAGAMLGARRGRHLAA
jgi:hypothetical protein